MKILSILLLSAFLIMGNTSCKTKQKATSSIDISKADNSMTSLDWNGMYTGILPCADCSGIKTQLTLNQDLSYILKTQYIDKSDSVFQESGSFKWNSNGGSITLENKNQQIYQVGENILFQLDKNGQRITGDLADKYNLQKEKTKLTGKYWKLVQLSGNPLEQTDREPFIKFNEDLGVTGNNSCNSFGGNYELSDENSIKFSPFAMTRMACIGNSVEQEFMQALEQTKRYSLNESELVFLDESGTQVAQFKADFFK